ncbi:MAG: hypothetical protein K0R48_291 [Gammaproteobacteria bacterium]|jgi:type II secretory pathway pseudopilin PulG|nr:hypothetical protein [Gammaproteobacteria bacterium]
MTVAMRCKQKGLTLLETVLALAVGVVVIMAVVIYFQTANSNANMVATINITRDIGNAVRAYAQTPNYTSGKVPLADLQAAGLLAASDTVNPWSIQPNSLVVSTSGNYLGISFYNVPVKTSATSTFKNKAGGICGTLATQLSSMLPLPSPGTVTLNGVTHKYGTYTLTNPTGGGVTAVGKDKDGNTITKTAQGAAVCQYTQGASTGTLSIVMDLT